jgi:N-methylhydantoinase A
VERGLDPRDFTLAAFGGSGPAHACDLAGSLDISRVMLPMMPGVFTALGMLTGDVERHFLTAMPGLLQDLDGAALSAAVADLHGQAEAALREENFTRGQMQFAFNLELRFEGQDSELPVRLPDDIATVTVAGLRQAFLTAYEEMYRYVTEDEVEMVNLRLLARGLRQNKLDFTKLATGGNDAAPAPARTRQVYFGPGLGWIETKVIDRAAFADQATDQTTGPLILESADSTIVVPPGGQITGDSLGNLFVDLKGEQRS